mgnify:CR=1 FL=1
MSDCRFVILLNNDQIQGDTKKISVFNVFSSCHLYILFSIERIK